MAEQGKPIHGSDHYQISRQYSDGWQVLKGKEKKNRAYIC